MRRALRLFAGGLLALLLAAQPALAQRAIGWGSTVSGEIAFSTRESREWIPFTRTPAGLVTLRGEVNGKPILALLDTGSPYTSIDIAFAKQNGIALTEVMAPARNRLRVLRGPIETMTIGPITQTGGSLAAIDLSNMQKLMNVPLTMLLGADFLCNVAIEFDFDHDRLRILPSGAQGPDGIRVPLRLVPLTNRFLISMKVGDVPVNRVLIDTGINATMSVTTAVWARLPLTGVPVTSARAVGLYGPEVWPLARFQGVTIGPAAIPGKMDVLADPDGILDSPVDGMIGMEALRNFNVFLDPGAGHMILSPRLVPHRMPVPNTIGLIGFRVPQGFSIQHVMNGSPAALAGVKDGDMLCTVDGQSIASGQPAARENWAAKPVGTTLALGLCSGKQIPVTLREFY